MERIIVRSDAVNEEGLVLVKRGGSIEPADNKRGLGANRLLRAGFLPTPPRETISGAHIIALQKSRNTTW